MCLTEIISDFNRIDINGVPQQLLVNPTSRCVGINSKLTKIYGFWTLQNKAYSTNKPINIEYFISLTS